MKLLVSETSLSLWQEVVLEAEATSQVALKNDMESYLVLLLVRYMNQPDLVRSILANDFFQANDSRGKAREMLFKTLGDNCLLLAGFFPGLAEKKRVKISYFTQLGQAAYASISKQRNDLYGSLAHQFVSMMDVLQSIRVYSKDFSDLLPLQAYELWSETGSQRAFHTLRQYSQAIPLKLPR